MIDFFQIILILVACFVGLWLGTAIMASIGFLLLAAARGLASIALGIKAFFLGEK